MNYLARFSSKREKMYSVELVTNETTANIIEISCRELIKVDHTTLIVDGYIWVVPAKLGMSFAEIKLADT
jgi:hypothetical protein